MEFYEGFIKPLLFALPADTTQSLAEFLFRRQFLWKSLASKYAISDPRLTTNLAGLKLSNPIGLAAGYDKDCRFLPSVAALGFGYLVGGTVTLQPRPGNPKPRVVRNPTQRSLINAMGFPSQGAHAVAQRLQKMGERDRPLLLSVGGITIDEFLQCHKILEPLADAIELNISSPNTDGLRIFQEPRNFTNLVKRINEQRRKPSFVKLPPYFDSEGKEKVLNLVRICQDLGISGVTAINTKPVSDSRLKVGSGGLSGKPLFEDMLRIVSEIHKETGAKLPINACGGIFSAEDTFKVFIAGAATVQALTAIVYKGPGVVKAINLGLMKLLDEKNISSVAALRNAPGVRDAR